MQRFLLYESDIKMDQYKCLYSFCFLCCFLLGCSTQSPITLEEQIKSDPDQVIQEQIRSLSRDEQDATAHYRLALAYFNKGNYPKADFHIKRATKLAPLNGIYFELLGDISFEVTRYGEALNSYKSAIRLQPELISTYPKLALVYEQLQDIELAIATLEESLTRERLYLEAYFHLARLFLEQKEYDRATESINTALSLEPKNEELLLLQIRIQAAQGNFFHAKTLIEQLLQETSNTHKVHREQLNIFFIRQQWQEAYDYLKNIATTLPLRFEDRLIQAQVLIHLNQPKEAETLLKSMLEERPKNVSVIQELALLFLHEGQLESAQQWLENRVEIDGGDAHTHFLLATIFFKNRDFLQGDLALNRALDANPINEKYQLLSLRRRLMKGELLAVEAEVQKLLKKDPLNLEILRIRADLFTLQGKYDKAEELIRQLMVIQDSDIFYFSLARVLYLKQAYQSALDIVTPLVQKHPEDWESAYLYAATAFQLGNFEDSVQLLSTFAEGRKGSGFIHRLLGDFYRYGGDEAQAKKIYQKGLDWFPRQIYLIDALSASYVVTRQWKEAHDLILKGIEQKHPLKPVLLERLIQVTQLMGDLENSKKYLQTYYREIDPIINAKTLGSDKSILFPVASPVLAFPELVPGIATEN